MRTLILCVLGSLAAAASSAPVTIEAAFSPGDHTVSGTMRIAVEGSLAEAWFALLGNLGREPNPYVSPLVQDGTYVAGFDPAWTEIERVAWATPGGETELPYDLLPAPPTLQTYSLGDVLLRVPLPGGPGEIVIEFRTRFPHLWLGEPGRLGDVHTWRFGWHPVPTASPTDGRWPFVLPAHDYRLRLTVPEGWIAALPGEVAEERVEKETRYTVRFAGPVRSISLFLAPQGSVRPFTLSFPGVTVEGVALPGDEDKLRTMATYVPEILAYYGERYGAYPEGRVLLVEHPNEVGVAMTADGVVFLPRWYFRRQDLTARGVLSRYGQYILAHELAHLWWGIGIGVDFDAENWLSEGTSQYLAIRWFEDRYGATGGNVFALEGRGLGEEVVERELGFLNLREHLTELPYMERAFSGFDEALAKPLSEVRYEQATGDRLYNKGYLVLRAAAALAGEDAFDRVLREAHARWRAGRFGSSDLQALLEGETGRDWGPFFAAWVYGEAWADYAALGLTRSRDGEEHVTVVQLSRRGTGAMPVTVEVQGPKGERERARWDAEAETATLEFRTTFPVVRAVVDPDGRAPDVDRLNNAWPRKFTVALDRNALPLDAYLVRPDLESEGMTIQYLDRFGWGIFPQALAVAGWVRYGREGALSGWAALGETLLGALSFTRYLWNRPTLGTPGTYWERVGELTLTVSRRPEWGLGLDLAWGENLARAHAGGLSLLWLPGVGWAAELGHTHLLGLFPHAYLTLGARFGLASPGAPEKLLPALTELRTLPGEALPQGERKTVFSLGIWLPPLRPDYSLGGAALVTEVRPRLYLSWARLWKRGQEGETIAAYLEAGAEAVATLELLGGLAAVQVILGVGWPLVPGGEAVFYFGLGL
ncbi:MAG: M1 family aminopeptidase [Candidatus Bipolaricaulota bacterium]|nr:M1 family aminopeptidase [Candidatus Bipolaricaulota bacterium]